ncbi:IS3 family transposase [Bisgaardia hudsonensis]
MECFYKQKFEKTEQVGKAIHDYMDYYNEIMDTIKMKGTESNII